MYLANILPELYLRVREYVEDNFGNALFNEKMSILLELSLNIYCNNSLLHQQICQTVQWVSQHLNLHSEEKIITPFLKLLILLANKSNLPLEMVCNIKDIRSLTDNPCLNIKWYAVKVLAIYLNVLDIESFVKQYFNNDVFNRLILEENFATNLKNKFVNTGYQRSMDVLEESSRTQKYLDQNDFRGNFLPIFNMLLEHKNEIDNSFLTNLTNLILTKSTISNLKSFSLAVVSETPVLLSGGMGCGKTMLVEYFASCLGRNTAPKILKLQLGDQTDSKV